MRVEGVPLRDQVVDEDGISVVMVGNQVMVLSALATEVLAVLGSGPRDAEVLVTHLLETFGDPGGQGEPAALVGDLLKDLSSSGLVRCVTSR